MKKILFITFLVIFGVVFSLFSVNAQNQGQINRGKLIKLPEFSKKQLGLFIEIDDFVREKIASHSDAQYFLLNPAGIVSQQGTVESFDGTNLVVNSNGFKMTWNVATDTKILSAQTIALLKKANPLPISTSSITVNEKIRTHGEWDGSKLVAKRVILIQPKQIVPVTQENTQDLLMRIQEMLRLRGINVQISPVQSTSTPTTTQ